MMKRSMKKNERGQALVETALTSIIFILMALGTFDAGRLLLRMHQFTQIAREGARAASITPNATAGAAVRVTNKMDAIAAAIGVAIPAGSFTIEGLLPDGAGNATFVRVTVNQTFLSAYGASFLETFIAGFNAFAISPRVTMPAFVGMPAATVVR